MISKLRVKGICSNVFYSKRIIPAMVCFIWLVHPSLAQIAEVTALALWNVEVRDGPGFDYERVGLWDEGTSARVIARSSQTASWLRIDFEGGAGWVARFTAKLEGDMDALNVMTPIRPTPTRAPETNTLNTQETPPAITEDEVIIAKAFRTVNVRAEPSTRSEIITWLKDGDEVIVLARSDERTSWLWVDLEGTQGWVAYFTVSLSGLAEALPVVDPQPGADPEDVLPVVIPEDGVVAQAFRTVNVRSGPGMDYEQIGQLENGDTVLVTGRSNDMSDWLQIDLNGEAGWVAYFTVSVSGDPDSLPLVERPVDTPG